MPRLTPAPHAKRVAGPQNASSPQQGRKQGPAQVRLTDARGEMGAHLRARQREAAGRRGGHHGPRHPARLLAPQQAPVHHRRDGVLQGSAGEGPFTLPPGKIPWYSLQPRSAAQAGRQWELPAAPPGARRDAGRPLVRSGRCRGARKQGGRATGAVWKGARSPSDWPCCRPPKLTRGMKTAMMGSTCGQGAAGSSLAPAH